MHQRCVSRNHAGTLLDEDFSQVIRNDFDQEGKEGNIAATIALIEERRARVDNFTREWGQASMKPMDLSSL